MQRKLARASEGLLCNEQGYLLEGILTNLFIVAGAVPLTNPCADKKMQAQLKIMGRWALGCARSLSGT